MTDDQSRALTTVCAALTAEQNEAILSRWAPAGSRLHGAHVADLIDIAEDSDALCSVTDPFFEEHEDEVPDIPGIRHAAYALAMTGREALTVAALLSLCERASLLAAKEGDLPMTALERQMAADAVALSKEHADRADAAEGLLAGLRDEIRRLRAAADDYAADLMDEGKDAERAYGRVEAYDQVLARLSRMEADR
jgi:hypothetical protein